MSELLYITSVSSNKKLSIAPKNSRPKIGKSGKYITSLSQTSEEKEMFPDDPENAKLSINLRIF